MRNLKRAAGALLVTVTASQGICGGLFAPMSFDSASVMPKGVRNVRVTGFTTEISNSYDGSGNAQPVANAFNRPVTWAKLLSSQPAGQDRGMMKGGIKSLDVNLSDVAGNANGLVNSRVAATVPILAYGVTDKFTIGMAVPVLYTSTHVSTGWSVTPDSQAQFEKVNGAFPDKIKSVKSQLVNVVNAEIINDGYKPLGDEEHTEMGDITLGGKYQYYKSAHMAAALAPRLVLPTGRPADVDKVVDIAPGDGHPSVGLAAIVDFTPTSRLIITPGISYTYQIPWSHAMRVPQTSDQSVTPDVDSSVTQKVGDIYSAGLGVRYKFQELWTIGAGYSLQYKKADEYFGSKYAAVRYNYLSIDTEQVMNAGLVGLTYSTVPLFLKKQFALPLEASLNFSHVFSGRNVGQIDLTSFDLAAFF
jgi:hypothetical protein